VIQITPQMRVLVAIEPVDLRKGIDGLAQLCREKLVPGCAAISSRMKTISSTVTRRPRFPLGVPAGPHDGAAERRLGMPALP